MVPRGCPEAKVLSAESTECTVLQRHRDVGTIRVQRDAPCSQSISSSTSKSTFSKTSSD
jgi:hypothetical protein